MTIILRIILIIVSLLTLIGIIKKVRNAKVQIESTLFWVVFSFLLLLISVFPQIADFSAKAVGIYSTANFVFVFVIFILLVHQFYSDIKISQLEAKINELIEEIAIRENNTKKDDR